MEVYFVFMKIQAQIQGRRSAILRDFRKCHRPARPTSKQFLELDLEISERPFPVHYSIIVSSFDVMRAIVCVIKHKNKLCVFLP